MSNPESAIPLISIIIPVYNTEQYLRPCLESLQSQTMKDIEFICINDGSTDGSETILAEYAQQDSRFRVLEQLNSGVATARNKGLAESRGKYIMFCDSDDRYEPQFCEEMYRVIEKYNVDFVMCNTFIEAMDRSQKETERFYFPLKEGVHFIQNSLRITLNGVLWNKIFRREIVEQYDISFPDIYTGDDDAFCRSYFFVSQTVYFLNKKLYHYILRSGSITDRCLKQKNHHLLLSIVKMAEHLYYFLKRNLLLLKYKKIVMRHYIHCCTNAWRMFPVRLHEELLEEIREFVLKNEIKQWHFYRGNKLYHALKTGNNLLAVKIIDKVPCCFKKWLLLLKYTAFASWSKDAKRKRYHKKLIHLLYQERTLQQWKVRSDNTMHNKKTFIENNAANNTKR